MQATSETARHLLASIPGAGFAYAGHIYETSRHICADAAYTPDRGRGAERTIYFTVLFPKGAPVHMFRVRYRYGTGRYARYHGDAEYIEDTLAEAICEATP